MFSLLDEIEKIEPLALKVIFENGREVEPTDLQLYMVRGAATQSRVAQAWRA